jgi:hypothetical protein
MKKVAILGSLLLGMSCMAFAQLTTVGTAPEIDPSQAMTALALLTGCSLVIRGRRRK